MDCGRAHGGSDAAPLQDAAPGVRPGVRAGPDPGPSPPAAALRFPRAGGTWPGQDPFPRGRQDARAAGGGRGDRAPSLTAPSRQLSRRPGTRPAWRRGGRRRLLLRALDAVATCWEKLFALRAAAA